MRGDEQEPDMRCGTSGTSGHVTTKSSIRDLGVLYKSGVYALKALCLTPGGLTCVPSELRVEQSTLIACEKSAEGIVVVGETSRVDTRRPHPDEGLNGFQKELNDRKANRQSGEY